MQLVDAYVRAEFRETDGSEFNEFARRLEERVGALGREFSLRIGADDQLELLYDFEQGSLRTLVKVFGVLTATYVAISQYPDFREGVIQLYHDATAVAATIREEFKAITGARDSDVIYSRAVSRDVNRLYRIVQNMDQINSAATDLEALTESRDRIVTDITDLYRSNPNERVEIQQIINILSKDIPPAAPIPYQIDEVVDSDRRNRWMFSLQRLEPVGRPPARVHRRPRMRYLKYERTIRI